MNEEKINTTIGNNLSYYLRFTGRSMSDLARYLNVSQTAVSNWCKGLKIPRMDKIDKICVFFQISRSDLMDEHIDNENNNRDEDKDKIKAAVLYEKYKNADPKIQAAVEALLKS